MSTTKSILSEAARADIQAMMARYPRPQSAILPALHRVQEELGWVPPEAQAEIAELFRMPAANVQSMVTFYYMYHRQPVGRYVLKACRSISCWLRGSEDLIRQLEERLGIKLGETDREGLFTLVGGECLAGCAGAPVLQVNDRFFENAVPERVDELLDSLRRGDDRFPPGPTCWRRPGGED
ncbi:MAG: NADH-quinone oxidoreductase subunit NuoE [Armatimonadetes bacterium]|nr:NADH-quinone oxidoreductase subunit NuoE [Armatimonadota bacterium]